MAPPSIGSLASTPLSVLDLAPVVEGSTAANALRNSLELARHVEHLGYKRHWVAEHHNLPGVASSATSVLMAHLAAGTTSIRIGSGGIMLPNHAPLLIAEQFGTLEALHPGRIDLGIGRAPGTDPLTARALRRSLNQDGDDLPELLGELLGFFTGAFPEGHPFQAISAHPGRGNMPEVWLLGSSGYSAQLAGILGLPFAFAHHFSPDNTVPALSLYRSRFCSSEVLHDPLTMVVINVVCARTSEEAARLAGPGGLLSLRRLRGGAGNQLPSLEEALCYPYSEDERDYIERRNAQQAIGDPEQVGLRLQQLLDETDADELMITTTTFEERDRLVSYELVAGISGLESRSQELERRPLRVV